MEGPSPAPGGERWRRVYLPILVIVAGAIVILATVAYFAPQGPSTPPNTPPYGLAISVSPPDVDNTTTVTFTALVSDQQDPSSAIQVRWAWQSTGSWDTNWSTGKVVQHLFPVPGNYTIELEARDTGGLTANTSRSLTVTRRLPPGLRIGTVLSLTGSLGPFGLGQQDAVDMAVAEINAAGGVLGQPIQVFHTDDQTNPSVAASLANTLIASDHVDAIIGSTGSAMCASILLVAAANAVMEVSPSCTSPLFTNLSLTGGWFARTVPSDALQAVVAASYAHANLSINYSAVIGINNAYGTLTAQEYARSFTADGGSITDNPPVIVTEVQAGATDYSSQLDQVMSASPAPQLIYLVAYPPDGVLMMQDWAALLGAHPSWSSVRWMFSEGLYDQTNFINPLVGSGVNVSAFEGTAPAAYAGIEPAAYSAWAARYANLYGAPLLFAANAYDATYLVALAAEAGGSPTGLSIRAHLAAVTNPPGTTIGPGGWAAALSALHAGQDVNYEGASGSVNVNATGDVPSSFILWAVNGTNQLYTFLIFPESLVVALSPSGALPQIPFGGPAVAAWQREPSP